MQTDVFVSLLVYLNVHLLPLPTLCETNLSRWDMCPCASYPVLKPLRPSCPHGCQLSILAWWFLSLEL